MLQDLRLALRTLARSPAFALTTIVVLALGIGANTSIFSLLDQLLLRPEGIADPERVVAVRARYEKLNLLSISLSGPDFKDVQQAGTVFGAAAIMSQRDYNYTGGDVPERLQGAEVSQRWFAVFGATPALGRAFRPEEDLPDSKSYVVVLSHAVWTRMFGGDPSIVGRTIPLNQKPYKVIGVMQADFRWPRGVDVWVPFGLRAVEFTDDYRFNEHLFAVARTRLGVSVQQADAAVRLAADRVKNTPGENGTFAKDARWGMFVLPITDIASSGAKTTIVLLMIAVVCVLLIACSNVAGLMVARTAGRSHELAVRAALGAGAWRMLRQSMAESLVLSAAASVLGLALAYGGTLLMLAVAPEDATTGLFARLDTRVVAFALLAGVVCAVLSAAAAAWQAMRLAPSEQIKSGGRPAAAGRGRQRLRAGLVVVQTALALVLLVGAGLLLRSVARLQDVNPGFNPNGVTTARLSLPPAQYKEPEKQIAFFRALVDRLRSERGIVEAAAAVPLPFSGDDSSASFSLEGREAPPGDPGPHGDIRLVTPGYFKALGIRLMRGRLFTDQDRRETAPVVVIDENLARQYWPNRDPIGRHMRNGSKEPWATVIGIVAHVKHSDLATDTGKGAYYYSFYQQSNRMASIVVRSTADDRSQGAAAAAIRDAVRAVDPHQPVHSMRSMADLVGASLAPRRFAMWLLAFFAIVALVMAALGLYGVVSYAVTQRTAEIGVRLALGAPLGAVRWMVVGQGLRLVVLGLVVGAVCAAASTRVLASQLFGTSAFDPATLAVTAVTLIGAALVASYFPARRATRVDPLLALKTE